MGILTVVGHATDCLLNAVGLAVLLYGRRKVGKRTHLPVVVDAGVMSLLLWPPARCRCCCCAIACC